MSNNRNLSSSLDNVLSHVKGIKTNGRVTKYTLPEVNVVAIRTGLGYSQEQFAEHYGFSVGAIRNWEQGRRTPEGPARILLKIIEKNPKIIESVLRD
jgi:putative transcriptional regulator